jgi:hypothetical protein
MKKILTTFAFILITLVSFSQSYYTAYRTEIHSWDENEKVFKLSKKNIDLSISIVVEKESVNIQAESPTMFYVSENSKTEISGKGYTGYRYKSLELKNSKECMFDIIYFKETDQVMIGILYQDEGISLRYYVKKTK